VSEIDALTDQVLERLAAREKSRRAGWSLALKIGGTVLASITTIIVAAIQFWPRQPADCNCTEIADVKTELREQFRLYCSHHPFPAACYTDLRDYTDPVFERFQK
jgi:hypothetical protein